MRSNKRFSLGGCLMFLSFVGVSHAATIAETLAAEEKALLARNSPVVTATKNAPAQLSVAAVYGISGSVMADVVYNGARRSRLRPGDKVGQGCVVKEIVASCVVLDLAPPQSRPPKVKGSLGKAAEISPKKNKFAADQCPRACWTVPVPVTMAGAALPSGSPLPPGLRPEAFVNASPLIPTVPMVAKSASPAAPY